MHLLSPELAATVLPLAQAERLWFAAPLIVSVSLVYAATRHEDTTPILWHALRFGGSLVLFMLVMIVVLQLLTWA
ncbi:MAG: hypothetical protein AAF790_14020 [Planctomycetota bacterium]